MYRLKLYKYNAECDLDAELTSFRAKIAARKLKEIPLTDEQRTDLYYEFFGNAYPKAE